MLVKEGFRGHTLLISVIVLGVVVILEAWGQVFSSCSMQNIVVESVSSATGPLSRTNWHNLNWNNYTLPRIFCNTKLDPGARCWNKFRTKFAWQSADNSSWCWILFWGNFFPRLQTLQHHLNNIMQILCTLILNIFEGMLPLTIENIDFDAMRLKHWKAVFCVLPEEPWESSVVQGYSPCWQSSPCWLPWTGSWCREGPWTGSV